LETAFASLALKLCKRSVDTGLCADARQNVMNRDHSNLHFATALSLTKPDIREEVARMGARKPAHIDQLRAFLEHACFNADSPFSTALGIGVIQMIPASAPTGLLQRLIEDPPHQIMELSLMARRALARAANESDLEYLDQMLLSGDDDAQAKALLGLSGFPRGRAELAVFLRDHASDVDSHSRLDLTTALKRSGLSRSPVVVRSLLQSGVPHVLEATLRSLADDEDWASLPPSRSNVTLLYDLLRSGSLGEELRSSALTALGVASPEGRTLVRSLVSDGHLTPHETVSAIGILLSDQRHASFAAEKAFAVFRSIESTDDVGALLHTTIPIWTREEMLALLSGWLNEHPYRKMALLEMLSGPNVSPRIGSLRAELVESAPDNSN